MLSLTLAGDQEPSPCVPWLRDHEPPPPPFAGLRDLQPAATRACTRATGSGDRDGWRFGGGDGAAAAKDEERGGGGGEAAAAGAEAEEVWMRLPLAMRPGEGAVLDMGDGEACRRAAA